MTKKLVTETITDIKYDLDGKTIEEAIKRLKEIGKSFGKDCVIDIGQEYEAYSYSDSQYAYVKLNKSRLENDEEYAKRMKDEQYYIDLRAKQELEVYERVKKQMELK